MNEINNKICMVVQSRYPNDPRVKREAEALERAGYFVDIICLREKFQSEREKFGNIEAFRILDISTKENIVNYLKLSLSFLIKSYRKLNKLNKSNKYKLIQIHNLPDFLVFSAIRQKFHKIPILLDLHDLSPELFESKWADNKYSIIIKAVKIIEKISCKFSSYVLTTSQGFVDCLVKRGIDQSKLSLIVNSPSKKVERILPVDNTNVIAENLKMVYHGTIAYRFGIHIAIEAFQIVLEKIPGSVLHLYGHADESYEVELKSLISRLGLENNVELLECLTFEAVIRKIQEYDLGVIPYLESNFMNLALSTKSFEYAKLCIPMVASDLKSPRQFFNDDAISYFAPGDKVQMAERILELCLNPKLRETKAKNAREAIEGISSGQVEDKYVQIVKNLLTIN